MLRDRRDPFGFRTEELHAQRVVLKELEKGFKEIKPDLSVHLQKYVSDRLQIMRDTADSERFCLYQNMIEFLIRQQKDGKPLPEIKE